MAKTKAVRGAASEAIRGILESGTLKTSEIKAALGKAGLSASDPLINNVRSRWKKAKGMPAGKRGRKPGRKPGRTKGALSGQAFDFPTPAATNGDSLGAAIVFCKAAGGIAQARRILAQLDEFRNM